MLFATIPGVLVALGATTAQAVQTFANTGTKSGWNQTYVEHKGTVEEVTNVFYKGPTALKMTQTWDPAWRDRFHSEVFHYDAYRKGDDDKARELYAKARMHYERIEPTAEAFGDIDPALDLREADSQEQGGEWTGWHVIEKDLWPPHGYKALDQAARTKMADKLDSDTKALYDKVYSPDFKVSLDDISNGAIGLLEEVATTKITGEEEAFSHTDLYDLQANVEGAKVAFESVRALAEKKDAATVKDIDSRFDSLQKKLDGYRKGDGFESYTTLDEKARKEMSDAVNALRRPLAKLTEVVVG